MSVLKSSMNSGSESSASAGVVAAPRNSSKSTMPSSFSSSAAIKACAALRFCVGVLDTSTARNSGMSSIPLSSASMNLKHAWSTLSRVYSGSSASSVAMARARPRGGRGLLPARGSFAARRSPRVHPRPQRHAAGPPFGAAPTPLRRKRGSRLGPAARPKPGGSRTARPKARLEGCQVRLEP